MIKINKYLHSCVLLEREGKKLLIDPGLFSFIENKFRPQDIGSVDAVLITHKHQDHCHPPALKYFADLGAIIYGSQEVADLLAEEGIAVTVLKDGTTKDIAGFSVRCFEAVHEAIPSEIPHNMGYLINGILHAGDSIAIPAEIKCDVWLMPVAAPWLRLIDALKVAERIKPRYAVPIHDAFIKDFMSAATYSICHKYLLGHGIFFQPIDEVTSLEL